MQNTMVLPYRHGSESVRALTRSLAIKWIKLYNSKYKHKDENIIINWGNNAAPEHIPNGALVINRPRYVAVSTNKLEAFKVIGNFVRIPSWTIDQQEAADWIDAGKTVIARHKLRGHGGSGIEIIENIEQLRQCNAPLYTRYVPKKKEFRVHIAFGTVIDAARKALDTERMKDQEVDWRIRNYSRGFIFTRDIDADGREIMHRLPHDVIHQATMAVSCLQLDFGAVDVIWNEAQKKAYVLEVNTAPGIEGTTLIRYASAFSSAIERFRNGDWVIPPMSEITRRLDLEDNALFEGEEEHIQNVRLNNKMDKHPNPFNIEWVAPPQF